MSFKIKIEVFEGPFDLLLKLILRQELDIHQVPIADITSAFMEHIKESPVIDLDTATEFLIITSTLLLIKARSLIRATGLEDQIEEESEQAKDSLVNSLIKYKTFSNAGMWLEEAYARNGWYLPSMREVEAEYAELYPDPFEGVKIEDLAQAIIEMLIRNVGVEVDTSYIAKVRISVEEHKLRVREFMRDNQSTTFSALIEECRSKTEIIGTFLALLELFKRGEITLRQSKPFSEIGVKVTESEKSCVG
ncbi:MAG: segregation/condensation protein A [Actinobacteria bacterium]|nr:segregation/condensation protein A [Actinomycetota bacterium]